jgi:S-formylglutathione hydrolase
MKQFKSNVNRISAALIVSIVAVHMGASLLLSQTGESHGSGSVERPKVHSRALEGNLEGDSPDREVSIYLPPSYKTEPNRRYPVVYLLHGFTNHDDAWFGLAKTFVNAAAAMDSAVASGSTHEMILVMPNGYTVYQGNYYTTSVTTGDWETFITQELVAYMDSHYRTIAAPASRGIGGHSSGAYGAIRLAMKHPGIFSSLYLMSPCCMTGNLGLEALKRAEAIHDSAAFEKADFGTKADLAVAASLSPNPHNPPYFFDLPIKDGALQESIAGKWMANAPLYMIDQYVPNLRSLKAIGMDAGSKDEPIASTVRTLDEVLTNYGIAHAFEIYDGDHRNRIGERLEKKALPFFSNSLSFKGK